MQKFLFSSFFLAIFAIRAIATEPLNKLPAIVIDTIYVSSGSLVVEYEVLRSFDQIHLTVQSSREQTSKGVSSPVFLSGNAGKGRTIVPISLKTDEVTSFNVFLSGGKFVNIEELENVFFVNQSFKN